MKPEWIPEVYPKSQPIWCPNCGEEFGIEKEIERAEKRGISNILERLIALKPTDEKGMSFYCQAYLSIFESMLKELEAKQ